MCVVGMSSAIVVAGARQATRTREALRLISLRSAQIM